MNAVIKQELFRHRDSASSALNNLCTVIHQLSVEGDYHGQVGAGDRVLGRFRLRCHRDHKTTQANVDLSSFDEVYRVNAPGLSHSSELAVGPEGYVVFHASGHHRDLWATLTRRDGDMHAPEFDSRTLNAGDLLVFRLWYPGAYTLTNPQGGARGQLTIVESGADRSGKPAGQEPVRARLSARGFEPGQIHAAPAQAVIVQVETPAAVTLTRQK